jgi:hypothetical protein
MKTIKIAHENVNITLEPSDKGSLLLTLIDEEECAALKVSPQEMLNALKALAAYIEENYKEKLTTKE